MATEHGGRVMRQPRKSVLRDTLAKAADTIAEKNAEIDRLAAMLEREFSGGLMWGCMLGGVLGFAAAMWVLHA